MQMNGCDCVSIKFHLENGGLDLTCGPYRLLTPELEPQKAVITETVLPPWGRLLEHSGFLWGVRLRMVDPEACRSKADQ